MASHDMAHAMGHITLYTGVYRAFGALCVGSAMRHRRASQRETLFLLLPGSPRSQEGPCSARACRELLMPPSPLLIPMALHTSPLPTHLKAWAEVGAGSLARPEGACCPLQGHLGSLPSPALPPLLSATLYVPYGAMLTGREHIQGQGPDPCVCTGPGWTAESSSGPYGLGPRRRLASPAI